MILGKFQFLHLQNVILSASTSQSGVNEIMAVKCMARSSCSVNGSHDDYFWKHLSGFHYKFFRTARNSELFICINVIKEIGTAYLF